MRVYQQDEVASLKLVDHERIDSSVDTIEQVEINELKKGLDMETEGLQSRVAELKRVKARLAMVRQKAPKNLPPLAQQSETTSISGSSILSTKANTISSLLSLKYTEEVNASEATQEEARDATENSTVDIYANKVPLESTGEDNRDASDPVGLKILTEEDSQTTPAAKSSKYTDEEVSDFINALDYSNSEPDIEAIKNLPMLSGRDKTPVNGFSDDEVVNFMKSLDVNDDHSASSNIVAQTLSDLAGQPPLYGDKGDKEMNCPMCKTTTLIADYNPTPFGCSMLLPFCEAASAFTQFVSSSNDNANETACEKDKENQPLYCRTCQVFVINHERTCEVQQINQRLESLQKIYNEDTVQLEQFRREQVAKIEIEKNQQIIHIKDEKDQEIKQLEGEKTEFQQHHDYLMQRMEQQREELLQLHELRITELQTKISSGEQLRRMMHNRIQELRGNIRVFVRTRPFIREDGKTSQMATPINASSDGETLSIKSNIGSRDKLHDFKFDKAFPQSATQEDVYREVSDFVQSALDGYNVCLFSYGQTGSGKTHTMQGSGGGEMRGIIPRAAEQILYETQDMRNQNWEFKMSASYLEIYNEELKDLLEGVRTGKSLISDKASVKMEGALLTSPIASSRSKKLARALSPLDGPVQLSIKKSKEGHTYVEGLTEININTQDPKQGLKELEALMKIAGKARSVARTDIHARSSRSHSVFKVNLIGFNSKSGAVMNGSLNLCDLAGSERLQRTGNASNAKLLKETKAINKSLSNLGMVFNALANKQKHIPYRNSKLTYLLQDCLSGEGKSLMLVNLSPTVESGNESLCSLRFAQQVGQVLFGKIKKNADNMSNNNPRLQKHRTG